MKSRIEWTRAKVIVANEIATDVREIRFEVDKPLGRFQPGSHISIKVETPLGPAVRTYTCVDNNPHELVIAVKRHANSRGGSTFIWTLEAGRVVDISLPENRFELGLGAPAYLVIAGGIGVTPVLGMATTLAARGDNVRMAYATRSRAHMAYADTLSRALGDRLDLFASDEGNRIDFDAQIADLPARGEVYACGPIRMLNALKAAWAKAGRPASHLRFEVFGDSGTFAEQDFEVEIINRPGRISVRPDETLLDALLAAKVPMIFDCQRGECGLCAVGVVDHSTDIDHRDVFFSESEKSEGGKMCACVSRFAGGVAKIDTGYRI